MVKGASRCQIGSMNARSIHQLLVTLPLFFATACVIEKVVDYDDDDWTSSSSSSGAAGSGAGGPTTATHGSVPGGPIVQEVILAPIRVSDGDVVTFSAVVSDPDGFADIGAGKLLSEDGSIFYGVFAQVSPGAFSFGTSWKQLHQVAPIELAKDVEAERIFRIEFSDGSGKTGWRLASLTLGCEPGEAACDGWCREVETACPTTVCTPLTQANVSCDQICAGQARACSNDCAETNNSGGIVYHDASCTIDEVFHIGCDDHISGYYGNELNSLLCCCG